jgi:hypothetical protein
MHAPMFFLLSRVLGMILQMVVYQVPKFEHTNHQVYSQESAPDSEGIPHSEY